MTYEEFRDKVEETLRESANPLTWTEIRTTSGLPQALPNNRWVRRMDGEIGLVRDRDKKGVIRWALSE